MWTERTEGRLTDVSYWSWFVLTWVLILVFCGEGHAQLDPRLTVIGGSVEQRLRAIRRICEDGDGESLTFALSDGSPLVRRFALTCWNPDEMGLADLSALLEDPDPSVRIGLTEILGAQFSRQSEGWLFQLLEDPVDDVQAAAIEALPDSVPPERLFQLLAPLLEDQSLLVATAAAARLERTGVAEELPADLHDEYQTALQLHQLRGIQPEILGVADGLLARCRSFRSAGLEATTGTGASCEEASVRRVEEVEAEVELLLATSKSDALLTELLSLGEELETAEQSYYACLYATPLEFSSVSSDLGLDGSVTGLAELYTSWERGFGKLRSDTIDPLAGGDLWAQSRFDLGLFYPSRATGASSPSNGLSLALVGQIRRDQLVRHEYLSSWNGGGFGRARWPFSCFGAVCGLEGVVFGNRTAGRDEDYPERLVAGRDELGGDLWFHFLRGGMAASIQAEVERRQYHRLEYAANDRFGSRLTIDSPLQLRARLSRVDFHHEGPTFARTPSNFDRSRDATLLDGQLGFRIGDPTSNDVLVLTILGGLALPVPDELEADPQLTLDIQLAIQNTYSEQAGDLIGLQIGGRREVEVSDSDFLVQSHVISYFTFRFRLFEGVEEGIEYRLHLFYDLLEHAVPLGLEDRLENSRVGGGLEVRFLLEGWLGFHIGNYTIGLSQNGADYEVSNQFILSFFMPFGRMGFELEEPFPW